MDQFEDSIQAFRKCFFLKKIKMWNKKLFEAVLIDCYPVQKSSFPDC